MEKAAGQSTPAAIKDDTGSAGAHGRTFPLLIRLQLHLLSELIASGLENSSIALISTFSYVTFYFILILNAV